MKYVIVANRYGYLPESDPYQVDNIDEAISSILYEIETTSIYLLHEEFSEEKYDEARKEAVAMTSDGVEIEYAGYVHAAIPVEDNAES